MSEKAKTEALRWLLHLHHGVSKGGEEQSPPTDAEWQGAIEAGKKAIGDEPDLVGVLQWAHEMMDFELKNAAEFEDAGAAVVAAATGAAFGRVICHIHMKCHVVLVDEHPGWKWIERE